MKTEKIKEILTHLNVDFAEKSAGFNFRCLLCGDSKVSKRKKRGWVLTKGPVPVYFCHNCGENTAFKKLLRVNYPDVYHLFKEDLTSKDKEEVHAPSIVSFEDDFLVKEDLTYILKKTCFPIYGTVKSFRLKALQLKCLKYLYDRKLPKEQIKKCFIGYDDFTNEETNDVIRLKNKIIFPFYCGKKIYAFQARDLRQNSLVKYLTIKGDNETKIYNYFNADPSQTVIILEGPINAFFVNNSLATCGTISFNSQMHTMIKEKYKNVIWAFDNDTEGKKRTEKFLNNKEKCFIFPQEWKKYKDINDVVLGLNLTNDEITDIIMKNSFDEFNAKIKFKLEK